MLSFLVCVERVTWSGQHWTARRQAITWLPPLNTVIGAGQVKDHQKLTTSTTYEIANCGDKSLSMPHGLIPPYVPRQHRANHSLSLPPHTAPHRKMINYFRYVIHNPKTRFCHFTTSTHCTNTFIFVRRVFFQSSSFLLLLSLCFHFFRCRSWNGARYRSQRTRSTTMTKHIWRRIDKKNNTIHWK